MVKYYNINTIVIFPLFMIHDPPLELFIGIIWSSKSISRDRRVGITDGWLSCRRYNAIPHQVVPRIPCHSLECHTVQYHQGIIMQYYQGNTVHCQKMVDTLPQLSFTLQCRHQWNHHHSHFTKEYPLGCHQ